jgi:Domain of unknown function (DUF4276)
MAKYVIVPIVEGRGEVVALPILLQNWLKHRNYRNVEVHLAGPVWAGGKGNIEVPHDGVNGRGVEHYVRLASLRKPDAILILLDADEECPGTLASDLLHRVRTSVPADYPIDVVVAKREYEAWFLAAFPSSRFREALEKSGYSLTARSLPRRVDVEEIADCKKYVAGLLGLNKYRPTIHQPDLTRILPFTRGMADRSRSFRKLLKALHELLTKARRNRLMSERARRR